MNKKIYCNSNLSIELLKKAEIRADYILSREGLNERKFQGLKTNEALEGIDLKSIKVTAKMIKKSASKRPCEYIKNSCIYKAHINSILCAGNRILSDINLSSEASKINNESNDAENNSENCIHYNHKITPCKSSSIKYISGVKIEKDAVDFDKLEKVIKILSGRNHKIITCARVGGKKLLHETRVRLKNFSSCDIIFLKQIILEKYLVIKLNNIVEVNGGVDIKNPNTYSGMIFIDPLFTLELYRFIEKVTSKKGFNGVPVKFFYDAFNSDVLV